MEDAMLIPTPVALMITLFAVMPAGTARVTTYYVGHSTVPGSVTASGAPVTPGVTVACERSLEIGTRVWIEGVGERVCLDRMHRRYEGGVMNLDVAVEPGEVVGWTGTRAWRVLSVPTLTPPASVVPPPKMTPSDCIIADCDPLPPGPFDEPLRLWRGKLGAGQCQVAAGWTAGHCLAHVRGSGWTVYAGHRRVTVWATDTTRDLAHIGWPGPAPTLRPVVEGEEARIGQSRATARELRTVYEVSGGYAMSPPGHPITIRRWCLSSGPGVRPGMSGSGIYGADGALLGVVNGGSMDRYAKEVLGTPDCGGWQRIIASDVP